MKLINCVVAVLACATAHAASLADLTWTTIGGKVIITGCDSEASGTLDIPESIGGNPVISVGERAFQHCGELTGIAIPSSVETIEVLAFASCTGLSEIQLPDNLVYIECSAFSHCVGLASIEIPRSVGHIGEGAFKYCYGLTDITVDDENSNFSSEGGVLFDKQIRSLLHYPPGRPEALYEAPDTVTSVGVGAFRYHRNIVEVRFSEGLVAIEESAFERCPALATVSLPSSVAQIGVEAFFECANLAQIEMPESLNSIGESAFAGCTSLRHVEIPDSVRVLESGVFNSCSGFTSFVIPDTVTKIGRYAFEECDGLKKITIPVNVVEVGGRAFGKCSSLTEIKVEAGSLHFLSRDGVLFNANQDTLISYPAGKRDEHFQIPEGVVEIRSDAFAGSSHLTRITIPSIMTEIGESAFAECTSLSKIIVPTGIETIGDDAFDECVNLKEVTLPSTLEEIEEEAFEDCWMLNRFLFDGAPPRYVDSEAFCGVNRNARVFVWPEHVSSFGGSGAEWNGFIVELREHAVTSGKSLNGTISGLGTYDQGPETTLTAIPDPDHVFVRWTGDASGTINPLPYSVDGDKVVGAVFLDQESYDQIFQTGQQDLQNAIGEDPESFGYYTASQFQTLAVNPTLERENDGSFNLALGLWKSPDLQTFEQMDLEVSRPTINGDGELEINFNVSDDAAFFQVLFGAPALAASN